jgi:hypothetical protein
MSAKELVEKHPLILVGNHEQIIREIDAALHDARRRGMNDALQALKGDGFDSWCERIIKSKRDAAMPNVES